MADQKISALTAATTVSGADTLPIVQSGTSKSVTLDKIIGRIAGNSGAAASYLTWQTLTSNATANSTTTPAVVMTTTGVGAGTYTFKYTIVYQSSVTTTGVGFSINHTGTTGRFVSRWNFGSTGTTASTGIADQLTATTAGQLMEQKSERVKATVTSSSAGVATINVDQMAVMEGLIVVTVSGDLQLRHNSETAASTQVMANSSLELTKIA